jgi:uncharacterized protein DUF4330
MPIIDERGRLFGKLNIIDLALVLIFLVLVPLGYGAYLLFRTRPPTIATVAPNPVMFQKAAEQRVTITGEHLRPYLKVMFNKEVTRAFLVESPERAEVRFADLAPGTYDVVLYDEAEEVTRLKNGLTIAAPPPPPPPPTVTIQALGSFLGSDGSTKDLVVGRTFGAAGRASVATILAVAEAQPDFKRMQLGNSIVLASLVKAERRAATLRLGCDTTVDACNVAGTPISPGVTVNLPDEKGGLHQFVVDEVRGDSAYVADLTVQFLGLPEVIALMNAGDADRPAGAGVLRGAVIESLEASKPNAGSVGVGFGVQAGEMSVSVTGGTPQPLAARTARIRVPVEAGPLGWRYRGVTIRSGAVVTFETATYSVRGLVMTASKPSPVADLRAHR